MGTDRPSPSSARALDIHPTVSDPKTQPPPFRICAQQLPDTRACFSTANRPQDDYKAVELNWPSNSVWPSVESTWDVGRERP
jgi:hypothetical protein